MDPDTIGVAALVPPKSALHFPPVTVVLCKGCLLSLVCEGAYKSY